MDWEMDMERKMREKRDRIKKRIEQRYIHAYIHGIVERIPGRKEREWWTRQICEDEGKEKRGKRTKGRREKETGFIHANGQCRASMKKGWQQVMLMHETREYKDGEGGSVQIGEQRKWIVRRRIYRIWEGIGEGMWTEGSEIRDDGEEVEIGRKGEGETIRKEARQERRRR